MLNASNFSRNASTRAAIAAVELPANGNRRIRRTAMAKARQALTNTGVMDSLNEVLAKAGLTIHPTRGFRTVKDKRTIASTIATMTKQGFGQSNIENRAALLQGAA